MHPNFTINLRRYPNKPFLQKWIFHKIWFWDRYISQKSLKSRLQCENIILFTQSFISVHFIWGKTSSYNFRTVMKKKIVFTKYGYLLYYKVKFRRIGRYPMKDNFEREIWKIEYIGILKIILSNFERHKGYGNFFEVYEFPGACSLILHLA